MLIRLVLFLVVAGFGGLFAYRFLRSKSLSRSGGLDVFEIERLMKLAEGSQRLKGAMMLRVNCLPNWSRTGGSFSWMSIRSPRAAAAFIAAQCRSLHDA